MSRPYKEVILFNNLDGGANNTLYVNNNTNYSLKTSTLHTIWAGSVDKFIKDFELPQDSLIELRKTSLNDGADTIYNWNLTTINFKFNYQVWYKNPGSGNTPNAYCLGSNNTIYITCPNLLTFNGNNVGDSDPVYYAGPNNRVYNPNLYPLPISITSFAVSNKQNDFQAVTGQGTDSLVYLVFRFGVNGNDIEICLQTKDNGAFQVNTSPLIIPYATLTFTGFNKVKRLR